MAVIKSYPRKQIEMNLQHELNLNDTMSTQTKPYRTAHQNKTTKNSGETACCKSPSKTIQGETLTMQQIIQKHNAGQHVNEHKPAYLDVENMDQIDHFHRPDLDLTDLEDLKKRNENQNHAIQQAIDKKKAELDEAEKQKRLDEEIEKRKAEKQKQEQNNDGE